MKPLTPKRRRFVAEYVKDLNATKAAIRAGYTRKNADVVGPRLLGKVGVRAAVDAELERRALRVEVKQDDVLRELQAMATIDASQAFDADGALLPLHELPADLKRMIMSVETNELWGHVAGEDGKQVIGQVRKVKFYSKEKALELLGKHMKMFADKVTHDGNLTIQVVNPYSAPTDGGASSGLTAAGTDREKPSDARAAVPPIAADPREVPPGQAGHTSGVGATAGGGSAVLQAAPEDAEPVTFAPIVERKKP